MLLASIGTFLFASIASVLGIAFSLMKHRRICHWVASKPDIFYLMLNTWFTFILVLFPLALGALLLVLAYPVARVYLIVECFINLAHLPPAVYHQPYWSQFIPHFDSG